ncbi:D-alanyl-D-alanine-carboxypeptidase/D-alanyl-D-alanine-endopeptidase [Amorphus suaedae]
MRPVLGLAVAVALTATAPARAEDPFLVTVVENTGAFMHLQYGVPALVLGVVRDGEIVVRGFGERRDGTGEAPNGDTLLRIGSITKTFTGATLAGLVADGTVGFTDTLQSTIDWNIQIPSRDGHQIRLIELATHTSGLPREAAVPPGSEDDPFSTMTEEAMKADLATDPLLFAPGTSASYSNFGFNLLALALEAKSGTPYRQLLKQRVLDPIGLTSTTYELPDDLSNVMQGHGFDGAPMADAPTSGRIEGTGGLLSTPNDILRWAAWQLDRFSPVEAELRLLDQVAYIPRNVLDMVYGLDESGHMDALGLGWIVMERTADRPTILQKAGGRQGNFSYLAFAPGTGVGAFVTINEFNLDAAGAMAEGVNALIGQLAQP